MCYPLGKKLLLPIWFTKDFEGESFAPSLRIFLVYGIHWGRISYFLTGDILGKNLLLPYWGFALVCLGLLGKNLLPHPWR